MNATQPTTTRTRRRMPRLSLVLAVAVASLATYSAYLAMVKFGINVLGMDATTSMVTSGVFELLLFTVAVLAKEAASDGRPYGVLLVLTWLLSSTSGFFAAWDEIYLDHPLAAVLFRFCIPLSAALGWHLALIGHSHLSTGTSWAGARRLKRMQRFYESVEATLRAADTGSTWRIAMSRRALIRARSRARRVVQPTDMRDHTQAWADADMAIVAMAEGARVGHNRITTALLGTVATVPTETLNATQTDDPDHPESDEPNATQPVLAVVSNLRPLPNVNATETETETVQTLNQTPTPVEQAINEAPAQTSTARPAPRPATEREARTINATVRTCKGCGAPLPAEATARAQYCVRFKDDGTRDQSCKNAFNSRKIRDAGNALERVINPGPAFA